MGKYVQGLLMGSSVASAAQQLESNPLPNMEQMRQMQQPEAPQEQQEQEQPPAPVQTPPQPSANRPPSLVDNEMLLGEDDVADDGGALFPPTVEENKSARMAVAHIMDFVHGDGFAPISKALKDESQPTNKTVGELAEFLVSQQVEQARLADKDIPQSVLLDVGSDTVNMLFELARGLGVWNPQSEEQMQQDQTTAIHYATNLYTDTLRANEDEEGMAGLAQVGRDVINGKYDSAPGHTMPDQISPVSAM